MALDQIDQFMQSLGQLESGNNYNAVGPNTGTYGRARGRWQIMEKIWPAWAREAGLRGASWADPAAQDQVARYKMSQYYKRYGSWDLVAVAWFAGPGRADQAKKKGIQSVGGISDMLGTSVSSYVQKVVSGMSGAAGKAAGGGALAEGVASMIGGAGQGGKTGGAAATGAAAGAAAGGAASMVQPPRPQGLFDQSNRPGAAVGAGALAQGAISTFNSDMPEEGTDIQKAQIGQDTFGAILSTISNASSGKGGQILDLKSFLGMPEREPDQGMPLEEVQSELAGQEFGQPTAPPQEGGPMGEAPSHPGFAGLTDDSKTWTQRTLGQFPGLRFSSGHRTPEQNKRANGVPNSRHLTGKATDFSGSEKDMQAAAAWAKSQGAKVLIHDAGSGRHLHIEWP